MVCRNRRHQIVMAAAAGVGNAFRSRRGPRPDCAGARRSCLGPAWIPCAKWSGWAPKNRLSDVLPKRVIHGYSCDMVCFKTQENLVATLSKNEKTYDYLKWSGGIVPITISLRIHSDSCSMAWSRFEPFSRTAHSQRTITRQPASRSCCVFLASRATFCENFSAHQARLDAGIVANRHPLWRCQKQPFTKTTAL